MAYSVTVWYNFVQNLIYPEFFKQLLNNYNLKFNKDRDFSHASRKPDPGEPSSLENFEQTEILPEKVYQTEKKSEQTEILAE